MRKMKMLEEQFMDASIANPDTLKQSNKQSHLRNAE